RMPALAGYEDQPLWCRSLFDLLDRLLQDTRLDLAPLFVPGIQLTGDQCRLSRIIGAQQTSAEAGFTQAPTGIHAGPKQKTEVIGRWPFVEARHIGQGP